jgi:glycosidase
MNPTFSKTAFLWITLLTGLIAVNPVRAADASGAAATVHKSPDWLASSVVYQIFPRSFSTEGDFNAITARLDELQDLGVDILWLMPIHPIGEKMKKGSVGSPYAVRDFRAINPDYGTDEDLRRLVDEAHKRKMRVVLDIVTGHTSWDSVLMARPEFYKKDVDGRIMQPNPAWTDVAALDYANDELRRYMIDTMKYWVMEYGVDGFRCDVAFAVPIDFWKTVRKELTELNPEVILLADADAKPALLLEAFDVDNSWPLLYALNRVMSGHSRADLLRSSWENTRQQFPEGALHLRFSDGQPEPRAVARYGVHGALATQVLMLMLDGVPLFYNGMEVGDATESADPALFEKVPVFWNPAGRPPLRDIYRDLIKLRKQHTAFHNDEVLWLPNTVPGEVVSFMRQDDKDAFVILVNLSSRLATGSVELPSSEGFKPVSIKGVSNLGADDLPTFRLGGYEWRIYHKAESE